MHKRMIARISKIIALLILSSCFILLLLSGIDFYIIQPTFKLLEEQQALEDGRRVTSAIVHENSNLGDLANDWATWDDTYIFTQDHNRKYIQANCADFALLSETSNIDLFFIFDQAGRILVQGGYQPDLQEQVDAAGIYSFMSPEMAASIVALPSKETRSQTLMYHLSTHISNIGNQIRESWTRDALNLRSFSSISNGLSLWYASA